MGEGQDGGGGGGQWYVIILCEVEDIAYYNWLLSLLYGYSQCCCSDNRLVPFAVAVSVAALTIACGRGGGLGDGEYNIIMRLRI